MSLEGYPQRLKADMERQMNRPGVWNAFKPTRWCDVYYHLAGGYQLRQRET